MVYKRKETGKNFFEATMPKTAELDIYGKGLCHIDLKKKKIQQTNGTFLFFTRNVCGLSFLISLCLTPWGHITRGRVIWLRTIISRLHKTNYPQCPSHTLIYAVKNKSPLISWAICSTVAQWSAQLPHGCMSFGGKVSNKGFKKKISKFKTLINNLNKDISAYESVGKGQNFWYWKLSGSTSGPSAIVQSCLSRLWLHVGKQSV